MASGGKREGAGRKPLRGTTGINKTIRFTPEEWEQVKLLSANYKTVSDYIRTRSLGSMNNTCWNCAQRIGSVCDIDGEVIPEDVENCEGYEVE